jgi:hypothetical protein
VTQRDHQTLVWLTRKGTAPQGQIRPKALQTLARRGFVTFERGMVRPTEDGICYAQAYRPASSA